MGTHPQPRAGLAGRRRHRAPDVRASVSPGCLPPPPSSRAGGKGRAERVGLGLELRDREAPGKVRPRGWGGVARGEAGEAGTGSSERRGRDPPKCSHFPSIPLPAASSIFGFRSTLGPGIPTGDSPQVCLCWVTSNREWTESTWRMVARI